MQVALSPVTDFAALGERWQNLQHRCDHSFFLDWTFLGCQVETRFKSAMLLSVTDAEGDALLALIGQGRLHETGKLAHDRVFIEHNGFLVRRDANATVSLALRTLPRLRPLTLSGIGADLLAEACHAGWLGAIITREAPYAVLPLHPDSPVDAVPQASPNLRAQLRRSLRLYGAGLSLERAGSINEALSWFDALVVLHQARWTARGQPGAFADPAAAAFHRLLIARGHPTGQIDILRIATSERTIGLLYQFTHCGRVLAYQSGFAYGADNREKPGLVCHALAMAHYARQRFGIYDFLAGSDRYKRSLATDTQPLHWTTLYQPWSPRGCLAVALRTLAERRRALTSGLGSVALRGAAYARQ